MDIDGPLWDLLDMLRLGDFFDDHDIPPIVFPIAVIAVIILAFFLLMPAEAPSSRYCGDGMCGAGENATTCPEDCGTSLTENYRVEVTVMGEPDCDVITLVLKDKSGKILDGPLDTTKRKKTFEDISSKWVYITVSSSQSPNPPLDSKVTNLSKNSLILFQLPDNYCHEAGPVEPFRPTKGTLEVYAADSSTGRVISAQMALFDHGGSRLRLEDAASVHKFEKLDSGFYYVTAKSVGYSDYNGKDDLMEVKAGEVTEETISLDPLPIPLESGKLEVCVLTEDGPEEASGEVLITDVSGEPVSSGKLSDCPLFRGMATGEGCYIFTLPAGYEYYAELSRPPSGCSEGDRRGPFLIEENKKVATTIRLQCENVGDIRAVVYGDEEKADVLTKDCLVELYYSNATRIKTMEISDDDIYTKSTTLPGDTKVYVHAKNVPNGYLATKSGIVKIEVGETKTVDVILTREEIVYGSCTQPARLTVQGGGDNVNVSLALDGDYGDGATYDDITYDKPAAGSYAMTDVDIPGNTDVAGPANSVESSVVTLELDSDTGTLSAVVWCNLLCGGRGDLNNDGISDITDLEILRTILDAVEISGTPPYGDEQFDTWPPACLDINEDGTLTEDDLDCLSTLLSGGALADCQSCEEQLPDERVSGVEVCGDGWDNDCDGQTDSVVVGEEDLCTCTENTLCDMRRETTGIGPFNPDTADRCALLSYKSGDGYIWHTLTDWECTSARLGETLTCNNVEYSCDGTDWVVQQACTEDPADNGDYKVKGTSTAVYWGEFQTLTDVCDSGRLVEYTCDADGNGEIEFIYCDQEFGLDWGCDDGRCQHILQTPIQLCNPLSDFDQCSNYPWSKTFAELGPDYQSCSDLVGQEYWKHYCSEQPESPAIGPYGSEDYIQACCTETGLQCYIPKDEGDPCNDGTGVCDADLVCVPGSGPRQCPHVSSSCVEVGGYADVSLIDFSQWGGPGLGEASSCEDLGDDAEFWDYACSHDADLGDLACCSDTTLACYTFRDDGAVCAEYGFCDGEGHCMDNPSDPRTGGIRTLEDDTLDLICAETYSPSDPDGEDYIYTFEELDVSSCSDLEAKYSDSESWSDWDTFCLNTGYPLAVCSDEYLEAACLRYLPDHTTECGTEGEAKWFRCYGGQCLNVVPEVFK